MRGKLLNEKRKECLFPHLKETLKREEKYPFLYFREERKNIEMRKKNMKLFQKKKLKYSPTRAYLYVGVLMLKHRVINGAANKHLDWMQLSKALIYMIHVCSIITSLSYFAIRDKRSPETIR